MAIEPLAIGVCSWSLQVTSVPELKGFIDRLGIDVVQIACGDPHHASWAEGDDMPAAAKSRGVPHERGMLGFPGEDYTTPQTIEKTGGFGDPATRPERIERFKWGLARTKELGLSDIMLHAGFIPEVGSPERKRVPRHAREGVRPGASGRGHGRVRDGSGVGGAAPPHARRPEVPEPEGELRPREHAPLRQGRPAEGAGAARAGHPQRPREGREPAADKGTWGEEVPLGRGQTNTREFVQALKKVGYRGPLCIEREVGTQEERFRDIEHGVRFLRECLAAA